MLSFSPASTFWHALMSYAILRTKKLSTFGEIGGSLAHNFRERETPNADSDRTPDNEHQKAQDSQEALAKIKALLPEKYRKNAVLCIEYLITASPEYFESTSGEQYFDDAKRFLAKMHGESNIALTTIHRDETSPHLVAYVVPKMGEKLNCREFLGGRAKLTALQTNFYEEVGIQHGLNRGKEGSKAKHQSIAEYYGRVNRPVDFDQSDFVRPKKKFLESENNHNARITQEANKHLIELHRTDAAKRQEMERKLAQQAEEITALNQDRALWKPVADAYTQLRGDERAQFKQIIEKTATKGKDFILDERQKTSVFERFRKEQGEQGEQQKQKEKEEKREKKEKGADKGFSR